MKKRYPKICESSAGIPHTIRSKEFTFAGTEFTFFQFWCGTQQIYVNVQRQNKTNLSMERVLSPSSRRIRWCIVQRGGSGNYSTMYPPKIAGPFKSYKHAIMAYMLLVDSRKEIS